MASWQLHDAKNRLSEVVSQTRNGAQVITVRGRETAVVVSIEDYRRLVQRKVSLLTFLRESPLAEVDLDLVRDQDTGRPEIDL
jgi:antitoxin Phd